MATRHRLDIAPDQSSTVMVLAEGGDAVPTSHPRLLEVSPPAGRPARSWAGVGVLLVAVAVQLVVLYDPSPSGIPAFPGLDKIVHATVFLMPTVAGILVLRRRPWLTPVIMAVHAPLSEVLQASLLPTRSGDPMDALADVCGVALGTVVGIVLRRMGRRRRADTLV